MSGAATEVRFRPSDLLREVVVTDVAVSPDGSLVAFARRTVQRGRYRTRIFLVGADGGRAEPLPDGRGNDDRPRFAPDGRSLLFLSDRSGPRAPWIARLEGGPPERLAELPGPARSAEWSPDGTRVLAVAPSGEDRLTIGRPDAPTALRVRDLTWRASGVGVRAQFASAFLLAPGEGAVRLTEPSYEVVGAFWSPDGAAFAFLADLGPAAGIGELPQAWLQRIGELRPTPLAALAGAIWAGAWSPGGALAVVGIDRPGAPTWSNTRAFVVRDGQARRLAPSLDRPVGRANWTDVLPLGPTYPIHWVDDNHLVTLVTREGAVVPYELATDGSFAPLVGGDAVCSNLAVGGDRVAVFAARDGLAGDVCLVEDGELRPLRVEGSRWLRRSGPPPTRIDLPRPDGHTVHGWLTLAARSDQPGPLVLHVHGGPHSAHGPAPWLEMLALATAGIHVLAANPRGSAGYGEEFARAVYGRWGDPDGDDLLALIDEAIARGLADPDRLGILGTSYGGFMVNWLLGRNPGRFAAGVSENPVTDQVGFVGSTAMGPLPATRHSGVGTLPDDVQRFVERSPYVRIDRNRAPLLLLHAEGDLTCPIGQSELVFTILRTLGRPVELVRYPDEDHDLVYTGRPDRRVDRLERIVDWFVRHLGGEPATAGRPRAADADSRPS